MKKKVLVCFTTRIPLELNNELEQFVMKEKFVRSKNQVILDAIQEHIEKRKKAKKN